MKDSGAIIFINDKNQALILQRGTDAPWEPNKWNLPGGTIEPGETVLEGAKREAREEAGLIAGGTKEVGKFTSNDEGWAITVYACRDYSGTFQTDYESQDYRWVSASDLSKFDFVPFIPEVIATALKSI